MNEIFTSDLKNNNIDYGKISQDSIVIPIADDSTQYYMLFPINYDTNEPNIDVELPYRVMKQESQKTINMNHFIQNKRIDFDYPDKKKPPVHHG